MTNPFPHDPAQSHAIDALPAGSVVTKDGPHNIRVDHADIGSYGQTIPPDDALELLPVGSVVRVVMSDRIQIEVPENGAHKRILTIGGRFHAALAQIWHFLTASAAEIEEMLKADPRAEEGSGWGEVTGEGMEAADESAQSLTEEQMLEIEAEQESLDRRSPDQDTAMEEALLGGTLPGHDRRAGDEGEGAE